MIRVLVYPLVTGQPAMFAQNFRRRIDADDYTAKWRKLGSCHIRREVLS